MPGSSPGMTNRESRAPSRDKLHHGVVDRRSSPCHTRTRPTCGRRFLQGQADQFDRRLRAGRRLRRRRAPAGALSRPLRCGQSQYRGAEHAGRRQPARHQLPLLGRAQGWHHNRFVRQRYAADRIDREQSQRPVRSAQVHLARLVVELRRRRLHLDGAPRSSAARSTAGCSISLRSNRTGRNGSNPQAAFTSCCSLRAARATRSCRKCQPRASLRPPLPHAR